MRQAFRSSARVIRLITAIGLALAVLPSSDASAATQEITYYHPDHLGSTHVVTNAQGQRVQLLEYRPFGTSSRATGTARPAHQFTGQRLDPTDLYFYQARYYDPRLGRFTQPDSLMPAPGHPQTLNPYGYVRNNPTNRVDPSGHWSFSKWLKDLFSPRATFERMAGTTVHPGAERDVQAISSQAVDRAGLSGTYVAAGVAAAPHLFVGDLPGAMIVFGATVAAHELLQTGEGRQLIRRVAHEFFDEAIGMSPRAAYVAATVTLETAVALGMETAAAWAIYGPPTRSSATTAGDIPANPSGIYPYGRYPGDGQAYDSTFPMLTLNNGNSRVVMGRGTIDQGIFRHLPMKAIHVGASSSVGTGMRSLPGGWAVYGSYGVCHTSSNITTLQAGHSNTVAATVPHWSTAASTLLYGNYGGGLIRGVGAGVDAADSYE